MRLFLALLPLCALGCVDTLSPPWANLELTDNVHVTPPTFSTTNTGFVDIPQGSITIEPHTPDESWLFLFSGSLSGSTAFGRNVEVRYLVNGVERGGGGAGNEPGGSGPWQHADLWQDINTAQVVQLQARSADGGLVAITDLSIVGIRLREGAKAWASESLEIQDVAPDVWNPVLSLDAPSPGPLIILSAAASSEEPSPSSVGLRLRNGASYLPPENRTDRKGFLTNSRGYWSTDLLALVAPGSTSLSLEAQGGPGSGSQVRYLRLIAIEVGAFAEFAWVEARDEQVVDSLTFTPALEFPATDVPARPHVVLSTAAIEGGSLGEGRNVEFRNGPQSLQHIFHPHTSAHDLRTTYGMVTRRAEAPAGAYSLGAYSLATGDPISVRSAAILVFGL